MRSSIKDDGASTTVVIGNNSRGRGTIDAPVVHHDHNGGGARRDRVRFLATTTVAALTMTATWLASSSSSSSSVSAYTSSSRAPFSLSSSSRRRPFTTTTARSPGAVLLRDDDRRRRRTFGTTKTTTTTALLDGRKIEPKDDEEEWRVLVSAFQMYKAAYGDLKVPSRFVVPAMQPWPESAWNLKLGNRVAAIRATGRYVHDAEERRRVLDDLGFQWRLRGSNKDKGMDGITFDQIHDALRYYRSEVQPDTSETLRVPADFVVPNRAPWPESTRGLPLGKKLPTVRSKAYLKAHPGAEERLRELGFEFDGMVAVNDQRFNAVHDALKRYKEIHGDLLVPQPYVVPENGPDWPDERMWGLRLGARVNAIRSLGTFVKNNPERRARLDALGFVWDPPPNSGGRRGRQKKAENAALTGPAPPGLLSSDDGVNKNDDKESGGGEEGESAEATDPITTSYASSSSFSELPSWSALRDDPASRSSSPPSPLAPPPQEPDWQPPRDFEEANKRHQQFSLDVGIAAEITDSDRVIKSKIYPQHPWFNDDFGGDFVFEDVVEALAFYKETHGSFDSLREDNDNDEGFIVPEPDADDDDDDDALFAGAVLSDLDDPFRGSTAAEPSEEDLLLTQRLLEEDPSLDLDLDLDPDDAGALSSSVVAAATAVADVEPTTTTTTVSWPEHLAGMRLGNIVRRVREGDLEVGHLPERRAALDAVGFDWGDPKRFLDVPFDKTMCAVFAYYMVRGDLFVYEDFVVPDEEPWPRALAGFALGEAVFRLRAKQNFLEHYYPRKKYMLTMLEFVWFPSDALPLDPDAPPKSWEREQAEVSGHPLLRVNAPPYDAIADIPSVDHPEAADRYEYDYEVVRDYYENELGVLDVGQYLRDRGYDDLANDHEAKYGKAPPPKSAELEDQMNAALRGEVEEETFREDEDEDDVDEEEYDEDLNDESLDEEDFAYEEEEEEEDEMEEEDVEEDIDDEDEEEEEEESLLDEFDEGNNDEDGDEDEDDMDDDGVFEEVL